MSVLICGGAGYIGSHNVRALLDRGESVVVLDNLWTGHRAALPGSVPFYEGDVRDAALLVADRRRAKKVLGWTPRVTKMEDIVATARNWHRSHLDGYGD